MKNGIYIYGVIKASGPQEPGRIDISNEAVPDVMTVRFKDIAAVVSHGPLMTYDSLAKEKVIKDLVIYQFVLEKVMTRFAMVPIKFGTMVETEDEVSEFLENGYALLSNQLDKTEGKIELDIVAWWELPKILAVISRHDSQIQEKQQELAQKGENASTEDKVMLGQYIEQALKAEKARHHQLILQTLKQGAEDVHLHELANDEIILNASFLLAKKNEDFFHASVHSLDQQLESKVNFRVVGPLPPYSFSTILLERVDRDSLEEAKKTLGLTGEITDKAIRDAYHQLIKEYHPDTKNGEDTREFQLVLTAYRTLENFIENGLIYPKVLSVE
jgi:Gas vesicle synthesis protein GvpL/GvpF/DnaJ domain